MHPHTEQESRRKTAKVAHPLILFFLTSRTAAQHGYAALILATLLIKYVKPPVEKVEVTALEKMSKYVKFLVVRFISWHAWKMAGMRLSSIKCS